MGALEELHKRYGDRAQFLAVYVREAHPADGWSFPGNTILQPRTAEERTQVAAKCCAAGELTFPMVVDGMDDRVGHLYSGMPDRIYVIDTQGKVAYKAGRGPFGFKPGEAEQALVMLMLEEGIAAPAAPAAPAGKSAPAAKSARVPLLGNEEAWKRLPKAEKGGGAPLPAWARALAGSLPRTTAAMLELDYLHREKSPLDPALRAAMRWTAARANRCEYSEWQAAGDLRRAGANLADFKEVEAGGPNLPEKERAALDFARKMTAAAHSVTDAEVAKLIGWYGEKQVVAMVLLLAHANFQDRLVLTLGVPLEEGGPLPPPAVRFVKGPPEKGPPRPAVPAAGAPAPAEADVLSWRGTAFEDLQKSLEGQRARKPRVRVPTWEEVKDSLPPERKGRPMKIKWGLVCMGYQPELAAAWGACTGAFRQEAQQDRVFEESLFWVVTRSLNCFY